MHHKMKRFSAMTAYFSREFKWRFCILDGAQFSYFSDNCSTSQRLGHHFLTGVERLHCINRGLMLIDDEHRRIWAHAGHEIAEFEDWVAAFRAAIAYERKRRDGSIFERPHRRSLRHDHGPITQLEASWSRHDAFDGDAATADALDVSFTGWLHVRKRVLRLNWLFSSATRLFFVLSQRHLSGFCVNQEGRWVDFYGKIATARLCKRGFWLELAMDDGQRIRVAGRMPATTAQWHRRIVNG
uniref:PH domain-containing protein n=1 Tax=Globisporangium ultimum (strain ATCC 200006 / CBS 805.95 / DAOM BR144) TaxID=431595 RepID=K3X2P5_GLOUD